ncbi:acyl carrier protein [soil metagenome]
MSSIQQAVFEIISKEAPVDMDKISMESTLADLDIASLTVAEIVFAIEDHFNIDMPDRDPEFPIDSVRGLVEAVERLVAAKAAAAPAPGTP